MIRSPALATLAALFLGSAVSASAGEYTTFEALWVRSAPASGRAACGRQAAQFRGAAVGTSGCRCSPFDAAERDASRTAACTAAVRASRR